MHDNHTHPLLQQIPLTVSPFVNLPSATTLPYQYKPMPSTLPPSVTGISAPAAAAASEDPNAPSSAAPRGQKPRYVVSPSGHAAHPDEILEACRALHTHVTQLLARSERELTALDERIKARELAEKRRVAPGWLDSDARLLEPERPAAAAGGAGSGSAGGAVQDQSPGQGQKQGQAQTQSVQVEMLLQQPVQLQGHGQGQGGQTEMLPQWPVQWLGGNGYGHGPGGASEMAVPDEGEQLDYAFGSLQLAKS